MSYHTPTPEELADQRRDYPTVVEVGIAPLRVTIPLTSQPRRAEALTASVVVIGLSAAAVIFGGAFIRDALGR